MMNALMRARTSVKPHTTLHFAMKWCTARSPDELTLAKVTSDPISNVRGLPNLQTRHHVSPLSRIMAVFALFDL
jgi:hypothetical protein